MFDEAIEDLSEAIELDPRNSEYIGCRAKMWLEFGEFR